MDLTACTIAERARYCSFMQTVTSRGKWINHFQREPFDTKWAKADRELSTHFSPLVPLAAVVISGQSVSAPFTDVAPDNKRRSQSSSRRRRHPGIPTLTNVAISLIDRVE